MVAGLVGWQQECRQRGSDVRLGHGRRGVEAGCWWRGEMARFAGGVGGVDANNSKCSEKARKRRYVATTVSTTMVCSRYDLCPVDSR